MTVAAFGNVLAGQEAAAAGTLNDALGVLNGWLATVLFFDVFPGEGSFPLSSPGW